MRPSSKVIAETGRSMGNVTHQNRCHGPAPSSAAASSTLAGRLSRPAWSRTRLNGMPIQMLAIVTEARDQLGEVSQLIGAAPRLFSTELTTPDSLLSIPDQVDAETINGN